MTYYEPGDTITYRHFGDMTRTVVVTEREADIKNGQPGFFGTTPEGLSVWGYDHQIETRKIELPCFGMAVVTAGRDASGSITSSLKEGSPDYGLYEAAVDAIESIVLAHACAGVDVTSSAYVCGIETAVFAITDHLG